MPEKQPIANRIRALSFPAKRWQPSHDSQTETQAQTQLLRNSKQARSIFIPPLQNQSRVAIPIQRLDSLARLRETVVGIGDCLLCAITCGAVPRVQLGLLDVYPELSIIGLHGVEQLVAKSFFHVVKPAIQRLGEDTQRI